MAQARLSAQQGDDSGTVTIGILAVRDRETWHFDNPSSFDTAALVPHFFEQTYRRDNVWLIVKATYLAGVRWESEGGVTPTRSASATDYDTFFDPDGDVIVAGTSGKAEMQEVRASQFAELGRIGSARLTAGYRFRLETADFGVGHRTVTRNGSLESAVDVTTRETTSAQLHEIVMAAELPIVLSLRWQLAARGELAPAMFGRLLVQLPDKYPGQDFVFVSKAAETLGRVTLTRGGRWPLAVSASASRTWSYRSSARLTRSTTEAGVSVGRAWQ